MVEQSGEAVRADSKRLRPGRKPDPGPPGVDSRCITYTIHSIETISTEHWCGGAFIHNKSARTSVYRPGGRGGEGRGGGVAPHLSEVEAVVVRVVKVVVGAAVWVVKAVEVVEVRWERTASTAPPYPRFRTQRRSRRERQPRPPLLSRQSARGLGLERLPCGGCSFRGRRCPRRNKRNKRPVLSLGPSSSIPTPRWLPHNT
jgi:hypothetical protein